MVSMGSLLVRILGELFVTLYLKLDWNENFLKMSCLDQAFCRMNAQFSRSILYTNCCSNVKQSRCDNEIVLKYWKYCLIFKTGRIN